MSGLTDCKPPKEGATNAQTSKGLIVARPIARSTSQVAAGECPLAAVQKHGNCVFMVLQGDPAKRRWVLRHYEKNGAELTKTPIKGQRKLFDKPDTGPVYCA